ncbi:DUF4942 domain-containing protein [Enterovibrio norvegicus]|uniref:DUF4942 domain-containing protein n=1 Tax=Enterovibrio norvegicus TaxID=188144 RepID=UPI00352ECC6C
MPFENATVIEVRLIDNLLTQRKNLIANYVESIRLQRAAWEIAGAIDSAIPKHNAGYVDDFSIVFSLLAKRLGESAKKSLFPRTDSLVSLSQDKVTQIVTQVIDGQLWDVLFNRMGFYGAMSSKQKDAFRKSCRENPQPFDRDHLEGTLKAMIRDEDTTLLEALVDTVQSLSSGYRSNDNFLFPRRIIIEQAFSSYGTTFKLATHSTLQTLLTLVWRWALAHKLASDEAGISIGLWDQLDALVQNSEGDISRLSAVNLAGIEFRFFEKRTVHVYLSESMLYQLNTKLSETRYLK